MQRATSWKRFVTLLALLGAPALARDANPVGSAIALQARLTLGATPYTGDADFVFTLWDSEAGAQGQIGPTVIANGVSLWRGLLTTPVDFGPTAFDGHARWVEMRVRTPSWNGMGAAPPLTTLNPRVRIAPVPYASALPALRIVPGYYDDTPNVVAGSVFNSVSPGISGATIGGGGGVGDGANRVTGNWGTVAGGHRNVAGIEAGVLGGYYNEATGMRCAIVGGEVNFASGLNSVIVGGDNNLATGTGSVILAGYHCQAPRANCVIGGNLARSGYDGCFVWAAGNNAITGFDSTGPNQFIALAAGGFQLETIPNPITATPAFLGGITMRGQSGFRFWTNSEANAGVLLAPGGNSWISLSDVNAKENFSAVDGPDLLDRLQRVPVMTWNYKSEGAEIRHMGPFAQDFYGAFRLDHDDRHIATVDADGVALAGVKALDELRRSAEREAGQLREECDALRARVERLEAAINVIQEGSPRSERNR